MKTKVVDTIKKYNMLEYGDTVVIGLSGGADSMSLLHFLSSIKDEYKLNLIAAHVNHGIRGEEAKRDELFVEKYCKDNNLDIRIMHADIPKLSKESGEGEEECGRRIRYEFFNSIKNNIKIATAHTLSDSIETIFLNLIRGTTLNGLCGIPPKRDNIIRPLIECTRFEIEEYCANNNIEFIVDSTNLKKDYSRNRIRIDVIKELKEVNPSLEQNILKCILSNMEDEKTLDKLSIELLNNAKESFGYKIDKLLESDSSIRRRAIIKILKENTKKMPEYRHIIMIEDVLKKGGRVQIIDGIIIEARKNILRVICADDVTVPWELKVNSNFVELPFAKVSFEKKEFDCTQKINKKLFFNSIDFDKISGELIIRSRKASDLYRPYGRKCSKSLKKLFNESKILSNRRNEVIVLCDEKGIVWVENFGVDERVAVCNKTKEFLNINVEREVALC